VIPTGYQAIASLATNVRGEFAQLGYFNVEEAGQQTVSFRAEERGRFPRSFIFSSKRKPVSGRLPTTVAPSLASLDTSRDVCEEVGEGNTS
jgi:hypothetical protein